MLLLSDWQHFCFAFYDRGWISIRRDFDGFSAREVGGWHGTVYSAFEASKHHYLFLLRIDFAASISTTLENLPDKVSV
jgi:hypothetical protein